MKQTAIEWLEEELAKNLKDIVLKQNAILMERLFEQAKDLEKQQITDAYTEGQIMTVDIIKKHLGEDRFPKKSKEIDDIKNGDVNDDAEEYFNQTYKIK